jgi:hypothetical protein
VSPLITIAQCDDSITTRTYCALIGGAAHEAFHRVYSQQGSLPASLIATAIGPLVAHPKIDWKRRAQLVLDLQNVCEDIAIERIGVAEFPGTRNKLVDLADYIVKQEESSRVAAGNPAPDLVSTVFVLWRDLGLGYNTPTLRDNVARLKKGCRKGYDLVVSGILAGLVRRSVPDVSSPAAIARAKQDLLDGSALRIALEAVVLLEGVASGELQPPPPQQGKGKPQPQQGDPSDSDDSDDGDGGTTTTTTEPPKDSKPSKTEDEPQDGDKPENKPGDEDSDEDGEPDAGDEDSDEDSDEDGEPDAGDEDSDEDSDEDEPEGNGSGDSDEGEDGNGSDDDSDKPGETEDGDNSQSADDGAGNGAGGGEGDAQQTAGDFLDTYEDKGKGALDASGALEQGVAQDAGNDQPEDMSEAPYKPFSTVEDETRIVRPDPDHKTSFANLVRMVRRNTAFLKTRLASVFRGLENTGIEHGVRKARYVSDRMIAHTALEIRQGIQPTRAYVEKTPVIDMSVAACIVVDESYSMKDKLRQTCAVTYTIADALDSIGAKVMALGFRSKHGSVSPKDWSEYRGCHRDHALYYDLFKTWDERFRQVAARFLEIHAEGGTPMADGVEMALRELSTRPEAHRVIFVVTDGEPDGQHGPVLRAQLRRAREAGILVVGVGLGYGSGYVTTCFPDSVYSPNMERLPKLLVAKLELLIKTRHTAAKRGSRVKQS